MRNEEKAKRNENGYELKKNKQNNKKTKQRIAKKINFKNEGKKRELKECEN